MDTATTTPLEGLGTAELDDVFRHAPVGDIPVGIGRGTALIAPDTRLARPMARVAGALWKGKAFDAERGELDNVLTPLHRRAITAAVYVAPSRLDGGPCIVLDYSRTSTVARWVRDEMRQVGPGQYLGIVYVRSRRAPLHFRLDFT